MNRLQRILPKTTGVLSNVNVRHPAPPATWVYLFHEKVSFTILCRVQFFLQSALDILFCLLYYFCKAGFAFMEGGTLGYSNQRVAKREERFRRSSSRSPSAQRGRRSPRSKLANIPRLLRWRIRLPAISGFRLRMSSTFPRSMPS